MAYKIRVISNVGNVREKNEDGVLVKHKKTKQGETILAVVADGMGGLAYGEHASGCIVSTLNAWWEEHPSLDERELSELSDELGFVMEKIHQRLRQDAQTQRVSMGTTLSLLFLRNGKYFIQQAGDSRVYLIRKKRMFQITEDQTWCEEQVKKGLLDPSEIETHPRRHVLSNAIGAREEFYLEISQGEVKRGEKLLLCTDGYYSYLAMEELIKRKEPQKLLTGSEERILKERAEDNLSAILIHI